MPKLDHDPQQFYEHCVRHWLTRHPLLANLEVRASGTGLHAILWLQPALEFTDEAERTRWCSRVKIVQMILPTDPLAPGITATTRALGSINSKNGHEVKQLKQGQGVAPADVMALADELCAAPFGTIFRVLTGTEKVSPCPFCHQETLTALAHSGICYGCGKVSFEQLCNQLFQPAKLGEAENG